MRVYFRRAMNTLAISEKLQNVKTEIVDFCELRKIANVPTLIAVSKTKTEKAIQEAYDAGQRDFGENYAAGDYTFYLRVFCIFRRFFVEF